MDDNKAKALAAALQQIEKQFGKGSIMKMGDAEIDEGIQVVSTGSLGLDIALGVGGLPRGRVVEIYGPESSGKTTLCLQVVAEMQKLGGVAAFIDAEHALDPQYACWFVPARSTSSSSTRLLPSPRALKLKAKWATRWSACTPA